MAASLRRAGQTNGQRIVNVRLKKEEEEEQEEMSSAGKGGVAIGIFTIIFFFLYLALPYTPFSPWDWVAVTQEKSQTIDKERNLLKVKQALKSELKQFIFAQQQNVVPVSLLIPVWYLYNTLYNTLHYGEVAMGRWK